MKARKELIALGLLLIIAKGVINSMDSLHAPMSTRAMEAPRNPNQLKAASRSIKQTIADKDSKIRELDAQIARTTNSSEKNRLKAQRANAQKERDELQKQLTETKLNR